MINSKIQIVSFILVFLYFLSCEDHSYIKDEDRSIIKIINHTNKHLGSHNFEHKTISYHSNKIKTCIIDPTTIGFKEYYTENIVSINFHKDKLKNKENNYEILFGNYVFNKEYYDYRKVNELIDKNVHREVVYNYLVGVKRGNSMEEIYYCYLIGWRNILQVDKINKVEVSEFTDTLISTLPKDVINKIYPSFKGFYVKVNVDSIEIPNLGFENQNYIQFENIRIYGNHQWFRYKPNYIYGKDNTY